MTFWDQFWPHFLAIVLGGIKVLLFSWIIWFLFRKKIAQKVVGGMMKDIMPVIAQAVQEVQSPVPSSKEGSVTIGDFGRIQGPCNQCESILQANYADFVKKQDEICIACEKEHKVRA